MAPLYALFCELLTVLYEGASFLFELRQKEFTPLFTSVRTAIPDSLIEFDEKFGLLLYAAVFTTKLFQERWHCYVVLSKRVEIILHCERAKFTKKSHSIE